MSEWRNVTDHAFSFRPAGPENPPQVVPAGATFKLADHLDFLIGSQVPARFVERLGAVSEVDPAAAQLTSPTAPVAPVASTPVAPVAPTPAPAAPVVTEKATDAPSVVNPPAPVPNNGKKGKE